MSASLSPFGREALALAARGYHVLVLAERSKIPPEGSHGLHDATRDPKVIERLFAANPRGNLGIACAASRVICLDVDHHTEEADGAATLAALEAELGKLPETVETLTGTGGRHLYFAAPAGAEFRGALGLGLDIRHNAYCVCPSSVHPDTGNEYRWIRSPLDEMPAELPAAWLARMVKPVAPVATVPAAFKPCTTGGTPYGRKALAGELEKVRTAPEGERNSQLNKSALASGSLCAGGEVEDCRADLVAAAIAAGLGETESQKTVESGWRKGMSEPRTAPPKPDRPMPATTKPAPVSTVARGQAAPTETPAEVAIPPRIGDDAVTVWSKPLPPALPTPFAPLNRLLGDGLSGLTTLVAPTGVGKTGFALLLGRHAAQSMPVLYVSTELGIRQSYARIAGQILRRPWYPLFRGAALTGQVVASATAGLDFRCLVFTSLIETLAIADAIVAHEGKAPFMILDFLQGAARDTTVDRRAAVSAACDAMLQWCRVDEGRVALMVSSTARAHYATDDRVARDLVGTAKESGDVEFSATAVLSLRTEECPLDGSTVGQIHVAKSRFGTVGIVGVVFEGAIGEFRCDERQSLSEIERAAYDAIAAGAETKDAVRTKLRGSSAAKTAAVRSLRMRGLISTNPYRVIQVSDATETASNDIEQRRTRGPDADPPSKQVTFTDGEHGSGPGRTRTGSTVRVRPPIGADTDPLESPERGNPNDEDLP